MSQPGIGGRPPTKGTVGVRYTNEAKEIMMARATTEGLDLPNYIKRHYWDLVKEGLITPENETRIPDPGGNPYPQTQYNPYPPYYTPPYQPPYPPSGSYGAAYSPTYQTFSPPRDAMDALAEDFRKILQVRMMKELIQEKASTEEILARMELARGTKREKDDFTMKDMMQWQMIMNQQDRAYQQQMQTYNQQLEGARSRGDKAGENQALQLITALATTQAQQGQNNMQQMMAMMQMANNTQQTMYTTSINAAQQTSDRQAQERVNFQQQLNTMQQTLTQQQLEGLRNVNSLQLDGLKMQMESLRNIKDPLTQLVELDTLRKNSPILDAAFKGAFGIKEGGIGDMIPKLKELGLDKVIDKVVQAIPAVAGALMGRGRQPIPAPIPEPTSEVMQIPEPLPTPTPQELKKLQEAHLTPTTPTPTSPEEQEQPQQNPETIGYTNLVAMSPPEKPPAETTTQIPTQEPEIISPPTEQQTEYLPVTPESQNYNPKAFTTGRKKKQPETQP